MVNIKHQKPTIYEIHPIGYVRQEDHKVNLEILEEYRLALKELNNFSHAQIFWWFNKFDDDKSRKVTRMDPPFKAPTLGVFASRSPIRPNPIGITTIKISRIDNEKGIIEIPKIDAYNGSPILDIKPYIPFYNRVRSPKVPIWASEWPMWMPDEGVGLDQMPE